jgi:hypothetical protein
MLYQEEFWGEIEPCYGTQAWLDWNAEHPETWNDEVHGSSREQGLVPGETVLTVPALCVVPVG